MNYEIDLESLMIIKSDARSSDSFSDYGQQHYVTYCTKHEDKEYIRICLNCSKSVCIDCTKFEHNGHQTSILSMETFNKYYLPELVEVGSSVMAFNQSNDEKMKILVIEQQICNLHLTEQLEQLYKIFKDLHLQLSNIEYDIKTRFENENPANNSILDEIKKINQLGDITRNFFTFFEDKNLNNIFQTQNINQLENNVEIQQILDQYKFEIVNQISDIKELLASENSRENNIDSECRKYKSFNLDINKSFIEETFNEINLSILDPNFNSSTKNLLIEQTVEELDQTQQYLKLQLQQNQQLKAELNQQKLLIMKLQQNIEQLTTELLQKDIHKPPQQPVQLPQQPQQPPQQPAKPPQQPQQPPQQPAKAPQPAKQPDKPPQQPDKPPQQPAQQPPQQPDKPLQQPQQPPQQPQQPQQQPQQPAKSQQQPAKQPPQQLDKPPQQPQQPPQQPAKPQQPPQQPAKPPQQLQQPQQQPQQPAKAPQQPAKQPAKPPQQPAKQPDKPPQQPDKQPQPGIKKAPVSPKIGDRVKYFDSREHGKC
eukprot:gene1106-1406_t